MPHHKHARNIARLNFYEDRILFPDEAPQDIIGFCVGLKEVKGKKHLSLTTRRIGINHEYTDIRREVGNLLLRLWDHKSISMDDFWINKPRKDFKELDENPKYRLNSCNEFNPDDNQFLINQSAKEFSKHDQVLVERILEAYNPELYNKLGLAPVPTKSIAKVPSSQIYLNNRPNNNPPLLDIVRPTLFVFTMDSNFVRFVDECIIPKEPSKRLDPYSRNLRSWFGRRVLGWYSHFDADVHNDGGEFWYDLKVEPNIPSSLKMLASLNGSTFNLVDPGNGMGGGERFP